MRPALRIEIEKILDEAFVGYRPHNVQHVIDKIEKAIDTDRENRMLERRGGRAR